jgi:transaldolase
VRLFIDSADCTNWESALNRGWLFGATTNPAVLHREGFRVEHGTYAALAAEARNLGLHELHIQATGTAIDALYDSGQRIAALWDRVVVKMPMTVTGMAAAARLMTDGHRVTLTAAFSPQQIAAACATKAAYVAPYFGRLRDGGGDTDAIFERMLRIRDAGRPTLRILVASLRSLDQVAALAAMGYDTFTLPPELADRFGADSLTDRAATEFESARLASIGD